MSISSFDRSTLFFVISINSTFVLSYILFSHLRTTHKLNSFSFSLHGPNKFFFKTKKCKWSIHLYVLVNDRFNTSQYNNDPQSVSWATYRNYRACSTCLCVFLALWLNKEEASLQGRCKFGDGIHFRLEISVYQFCYRTLDHKVSRF